VDQLFPRALLACIGEDRSPAPDELRALADKIWREAISHLTAGTPSQALDAAHAALTGHTPLVAQPKPVRRRADRLMRSPAAHEEVELATPPSLTAGDAFGPRREPDRFLPR
jgi:hypothetical protein